MKSSKLITSWITLLLVVLAGFALPAVAQINLTTYQPTTIPSGLQLQWHTVGSAPSASTLVATPTNVGPGLYYAYYFDQAANCYTSASPLRVATNTCPSTQVNLANFTQASTDPLVTYHSGTPATDANKLTSTLVTATAAPGTAYYAAYSYGNGCYSETSLIVVYLTKAATPTGLAASPAAICAGGTSTLTATCPTGNTLTWYSNATLTTTVTSPVSPTSTTTYYATCTDGSCVSDPANITVTVNPTPTAPTAVSSSAPGGNYCQGSGTVTLNATCPAGSTVKWFSDAALTTAVTSPVTPTATTTYYAVCESSSGCKSPSASTTVNYIATPSAPINVSATPPTICFGQTTSLEASCSSGTLTWYTDAALTTVLASATNISPTVTSDYYAACVTTPGGCKGPGVKVTVTVNPLPANPTLSATTLTNVCPALTVNLTTLTTPTAGITYEWYTSTTRSASTQVPDPTSVSTAGTYYVYAKNANGCYSSGSASVVVSFVSCLVANPNTASTSTATPVTIPILNNDTFNGAPAVVGTNITKPTITTAPTKGTVLVNDDGTVVYTPSASATGSDTFTYEICTTATPTVCKTATVTVNIGCPAITAPTGVGASSTSVCAGTSVTLSGTATSCPSGTTLQWYSDSGLTTQLASTTVTPTVGTTDYYAACINSANCLSPGTKVSVTVNPLPATPLVSPSTLTNTCPSTSVNLTNTTTAIAGVTYEWFTTNSRTGTPVTDPATVSTDGTYYVFAKSTAGCYSSASGSVVVTITPCILANPNTTSTSTGTGVNIPILANDTRNGTAVNLTTVTTPQISTQPLNGTVNVNQTDGTVTYTPNASFTGTDTFVYTICDKVNTSVCDTAKVTITVGCPVLSAPTGLTASNASICSGQSTTLSGNACTTGTLTWYSDAALTTILSSTTVSPVSTTKYYAACVNAAGCKSPGTEISVTVNPTPANPVLSTTTLANTCPSTTVNLTTATSTPPSGVTYEWHTANNTLASTLVSAPTAVATAGTYYVYAKSAEGCFSLAGEAVTVSLTPCILANPNSTSTSTTAPVTINVLGNDTRNDLPATLNNVTTPSVTTNPSHGTVSVNPTDGTVTYTPNGSFTGTDTFVYTICDKVNTAVCDTARVTVTVGCPTIASPTNAAPSSGTICNGASVTLSADACPSGSSLKWYTTSALTTELTSTTVTPSSNTTYYVACVNSAGCKSPGVAVSVVVNPVPATPTTNPATLTNACPSLTVDLTSTTTPVSGVTYEWYTTNSSSGTLVSTPTAVGTSGSYFVYAKSAAGCYSTTGSKVDVTIKACLVATANTTTTTPGTQVSLPILTNDTYNGTGASTANVTPSITVQPVNGTATIDGSGNLIYTPNASFTGTEVITYSICAKDDPTNCTTTTATITVGCPTIASPANAKATPSTICQGASTTLTADACASGTLKWYSDANLTSPLASTTVTPGSNTTYYAVCETSAGCKSPASEVLVTVNPTPANPTTSTGNLSNVCPTITVNLNSVISNPVSGITYEWHNANNTLSTSLVSTPTAVTTSGTYYVFAKSAAGCYSTGSAPVAVTIQTCVEAKPNSVSATTTSPVTIPVIDNDTYNGTGAVVGTNISQPTMISAPTNGTFSINPTTGAITYTPNPGTTATTDTFIYRICAVSEPTVCDTAKVTIQLNCATLSNPLNVTASPNTICSGASTTLSANACDAGTTLTWYTDSGLTTTLPSTTVSPTTNTTYYAACVTGNCKSSGVPVSVTVNPTPAAPTTVSATPLIICSGSSATLSADPCLSGTLTWYANANKTGQLTSTTVSPTNNTTYYAACVTTAGCSSTVVPVTVTVNPTPAAPTAASGTNQTICSGKTAVLTANACATGTLQWYNDVNLTSQITNTTVSPTTTTTYYGSCVSAQGCKSPKLDAVITVNPTPTAPSSTSASPATVCNGQTTTLSAVCPSGSSVQWYSDATLTTQLASNVVTVNATTTYYAACITPAGCRSTTGTALTVTSTGSCNQPPMPTNDIAVTPAGRPVTGNVLTNDSDPDGGPLTVSSTPSTPPSKGSVTLNPDGTYTYTPNPGQTGTDTFCYTVTDNAGASAIACVTVEIVPPPTSGNDAPLASDDNSSTAVGTPVTINVKANDNDPDGNTTLGTPTLLTQPTNGTAIVNPDGTVTYTPNAGYTGTDTFTYRICDTGTPQRCDDATVTVGVTPPVTGNQPPVAVDDAGILTQNTPLNSTVATNDKDPEGNPLTYSVVSQPPVGTLQFNPDGTYRYTPPTDYVGSVTFNYQVCDNGTPQKCDQATVTLAVLPPRTKVKLLAKVWLQGSLFGVTDAAGVMRDDLRAKNLLPTTQPYAAFGLVEGTPTTAVSPTVFANASATDAIVDWVFVELRDAANNQLVRDSRAALVQRDGDIVDIDGVTPITFNSVTNGSYFVTVKHRNHLGVMTANAVPLTDVGTTVDFRQPSTATFNIDASNVINLPQVTVNQGVALWAGNALYDNRVVYQGTGNDVERIYGLIINSTGNLLVTPFFKLRSYNVGDINMNGETIFQGTGNDVEYIYQNVIKNHPGNLLKQSFFIIKEQMP